MRPISVVTLAFVLCVAPLPAVGQGDAPRALTLDPPPASLPFPEATRGGELRYSWAIDGAVVAVTGAGWILSEVFKEKLAPAQCRWCSQDEINLSVTRALAWDDRHHAALAGDLGGFVATPLATLGALALAAGAEDRLDELPVNTLLVLEAVTVSSALNQLVKFSVGRERPFVADLPAAEKGATDSPADNNLSFYSGHSNLVFALAVSSGTIAHMRGYQAEKYIWGIGLPVASFVAYSRIAARKHYLTDVLIGSATGAALGFALPWFLHRPAGQTNIVVTPLPNGAAFAARW